MDSLKNTLRSFGFFRVLFASIIQYNSICFRVIGGLYYPNLRESVASVTALEFLLNSVLEVPMGYVSDRFGRARVAILGVVLVSFGSLCLSFAFYFHSNSELALLFIFLNGILIGIGKPCYSGSIEAFYQDSLNVYCISAEDKSIVTNSMSLSAYVGRYIPTVFVLFAFLVIYFFEKFNLLPYAHLISFSFFLFLAWTLYRDLKIVNSLNLISHFEKALKLPLDWRVLFRLEVIGSTLLVMVAMFLAMLNMGYYIVSLGRELRVDMATELTLFSAFMLGTMTVGWVVSSKFLPWLATKLEKRAQILILLLSLLVENCIALWLHGEMSFFGNIIFLMIYGAIFQVSFTGLMNASKNILIQNIPSENMALFLSIQSIPSFLLVGISSWIIAVFFEGALGLSQAYWSSIVAIIFGLIVSVFLIGGNCGAATNTR